jgi:hypothetical protein
MMKRPRITDEKHLAFIRSLPCLVSKDNTSTEAAHIRFTDMRVAKRNAGVGAKPDDFFVVPLSSAEHRKQHAGNEQDYWFKAGIDPVLYALALYAVSGNYERGCEIVMNAGLFDPVNVLATG